MEAIARSLSGELGGQALRYGATGVFLAALYASVYWIAAIIGSIPVQAANGAGFVAALIAGYALHSRWSFRGHGSRSAASRIRFLLVNLAGYGLNCLWVWIIVQRLGLPIEYSIAAIVTVTPPFTFLLNRQWAFA